MNALIEFSRKNVEPFLKEGREKEDLKCSLLQMWLGIKVFLELKFSLPCFWCSNDSVSTVWYAKYEGVYFLGFTSIFKGFDNFSKTAGVHWLVVY